MNYISTPLSFQATDAATTIDRDIDSRVKMIDNLIELIVFTPRGSFMADSDFGFEYWNHEYSNVRYRDFNNGHTVAPMNGLYNEITQKECQESIRKSLEIYEPELKHVEVSIELNSIEMEKQRKKKVISKYEVIVKVIGVLDDGLGVVSPYEKSISFFMEPTVKKISI
ncbi:hypothetical protein [Phocaeicola sp.]